MTCNVSDRSYANGDECDGREFLLELSHTLPVFLESIKQSHIQRKNNQYAHIIVLWVGLGWVGLGGGGLGWGGGGGWGGVGGGGWWRGGWGGGGGGWLEGVGGLDE